MKRKLFTAVLISVAGYLAFDYGLPETSAKVGLALERMRCGLEARTTQIGDVEIAYLEGGPQGEGVETIVLIHGFGADKDNFTRVSAYLTDRYHVVIPDLPGFGDSTRLMDANYEIAAQVERLHGILQAMDIKRFHMGGSSMGGAITIAYAASYPAEVSSLWLLAPGGVAGAVDSELFAEYRKTGKSLLIASKPEEFATVMDIATEKEPWAPYSVKHVLAHRAAADYELHKRIFDQLGSQADTGINAAAAKVKAPTLIVWGEKDRALHVSGAGILQKIIPHSELIVREGIGHLPMLEEPGQAGKDYLAFLDKLLK